MLLSMTAFGRSKLTMPRGSYSVTISSLNRKGLEIYCSFPREFTMLEIPMRKRVSEQARRGQVNLRIDHELDLSDPTAAVPPVERLKALSKGLQKVASEVGFEKEPAFSFEYLVELASKQMYSSSSCEEEMKTLLQNALAEAMEGWQTMRLQEGATIAKALLGELEKIKVGVAKIEKLVPTQVERSKKRLEQRFSEMSALTDEDRERLVREVALLADKMDITEEIARMHSHIDQFERFIHSEDVTSGKTLDFLTQEMIREMNTIGAKSSSIEISELGVGAKSSVERLKEQVQNIE